MSSSSKLFKKCCKCENIEVIEIFSKDKNRKDFVCPQCINCRKDFDFKNLDKNKKCNEQYEERRNIYLRNKRETDVKFRLITNTRKITYKALKGMTKQSSTKDILGIDIETYRKWIEYQFTPEVNWTNIEIDHFKPICMFNISNDEELKLAFNWKSTQPLLKEVHSQKVVKFDLLDYQLQFVRAYQFLKANEEEGLN